jgi:hypothetical protein
VWVNGECITIETIEVRGLRDDLLFKVLFDTQYLLEPAGNARPEIKLEFHNKDIEFFTRAYGDILQFPFFFDDLKLTNYDPIVARYKNLKNTKFETVANIILDKKKIETMDIVKISE